MVLEVFALTTATGSLSIRTSALIGSPSDLTARAEFLSLPCEIVFLEIHFLTSIGLSIGFSMLIMTPL